MMKGTKCTLWQRVPRSNTTVGNECMLYLLPDGETVHYIEQASKKKTGSWKLPSANQVLHGAVSPLWRLLDETLRPNAALCVSLVFQTGIIDLSFDDDYSTLLWFLGMYNVVSATPKSTGSYLWERSACRLQENAHASQCTRKVMLVTALRRGQIISRQTAIVQAQRPTVSDHGLRQVRYARMKSGCAVKLSGENVDGFGWAQLSVDGKFLLLGDPASRLSVDARQFPLACLLRISYGSYGANPAWMFRDNRKRRLQIAQSMNEAEDWLRLTLVFAAGSLDMVFLDFATLEAFFYGLHDKVHRTPLNRGRLIAAKTACILRSMALAQNCSVAQLLAGVIKEAAIVSQAGFADERLALQAQKRLIATSLCQLSASDNTLHVMHAPQRIKNTKPIPAKIRLSADRQQLSILPADTRDDFPDTLSVPLRISSISGLVYGPVMPAFAERLSFRNFDRANCFSILCKNPHNDKNKVVADIVCANRQQLMAFFLGLQSLTNRSEFHEFQLTQGKLLWEHAKLCLATEAAKTYGESCTSVQRARVLASVIKYGGRPGHSSPDYLFLVSKACSCQRHELKKGLISSVPVYIEVHENQLVLRKVKEGSVIEHHSLENAVSFIFGMKSPTFEKAGESGLLAWRAMTIAFARSTLDLTFETDLDALDWAVYLNACVSSNSGQPLRSRAFYEWTAILWRLDAEAGGVEAIFSEQQTLTPSMFVKKVRACGIPVSDVACTSLLSEADTDGDCSVSASEMTALVAAR